MYLRTPKRYQPKKRRIHLMTLKWLWLWLLTPLIVLAGVWIVDSRDQIAPPVLDFIGETVERAGGGIATIIAPPPLPTVNPIDRITLADRAWAQGSIQQAVADYAAAAANAPNEVRVHINYAHGLTILQRFDDAVAAAERAVTADPFSADAWAVRGLALAGQQRYAQAIASVMQALSLDAGNVRALAFMGKIYLDAGLPAQAETRVNQALNADPESYEANYVQGLINQYSKFDFQAALRSYERAVSIAPNMPQIRIDMAWAGWSIGQYDEAYENAEAVLETNPDSLDALYALGYFQYQVYGDPNKAQEFLNRCLQVNPNNISCLNYLATVEIGLGRPQAAAELYQRIIRIGTQNPIYYLRAGRTFTNIGLCRDAIPLLRTGYEMEQRQTQPDSERIAAFETFLNQCGAPVGLLPGGSGLDPGDQGEPLLVPLESQGT